MADYLEEKDLKTINGESLVGTGDISLKCYDKVLDVKSIDFGFGGFDATKSSKSIKVSSQNTIWADEVGAVINKGKLKHNDYLVMPLLVSSMPANGSYPNSVRNIKPIKVIHTIEMTVKDSFFVDWYGTNAISNLVLFKKEFDQSKLNSTGEHFTYNASVSMLTGVLLSGTFGEHNSLTLTGDVINADDTMSKNTYHQYAVAGDPIDSRRFSKRKLEDCEFSIDCYTEYIFEDAEDVNAKNIIWDSIFYPNAYVLKQQ